MTKGDTGRSLNLPPVRLRGPVPFVGRAAQLSRLHRLLGDPPGLVVLQGEAGIGKTRLVRRLLDELPGPVRFAEYDDVSEPARLGPLLTALPGGDDLPTETEPLFRLLATRLRDLSPLTLVLEDLHWADADSAGFLAHLAAHPIEGVVVLVTTRTPGAGAAAPIHEALAHTPSGAVTRITLPPLDDAEVRELAGLTLRLPDPPDRLTRTLRERTAGIPFVLEEVLRALSERGGDPLGDLAVPYLLRDVVLYRMRDLDETAGDVLGAAAVGGNPPRAGLLADVLGLDENTVSQALAQAVRAGLLHEGEHGPAFRHDLAREAVYDLVPALTRQSLHRRIARTLEPTVPRPVAVLAQHYRRAGDNPAFVRNAEAAADLATARGDDATATRFLLQTMDVAELPRPTRVRLAGKLGRSSIDALGQVSAIPVLERILADRRLPPGARGDLGLVLGRMLRQQGEELRGYTEIERAVPYLRSPARRAQALAVLGAPDTVPGRHVRDHLERLTQAQEAADQANDPAALLAVRIARVSLLIELGDPAAWAIAEELHASPLLTTRPREHARACLNWAHGALHSGCPERAAALAARGRSLVEISGYERLLALAELTDLSVRRARHQLDSLQERLVALRRESWRHPLVHRAFDLELALVQAGYGSAAGRHELLTVAAGAERAGAVLPQIRAHSGLARSLLHDDPGAAAGHAHRALDLVRDKGIDTWGREATDVLRHLDAFNEGRTPAP